MENIVYNHLLARGFEIYYYTNGGEIDLLCRQGVETKMLVNVCHDLTLQNVGQETKPLINNDFKDAQKLVIYWNMHRNLSPVAGVEFVNILDLLLAGA